MGSIATGKSLDRRTTVRRGVRFLLLLAAILGAVSLVASANATARARVKVADTQPVKIAGRGFQVREQVRLVVRFSGYRIVRSLRASRIGTFTAVVAGAPAFDPCNGTLAVTAIGSGGSRATAKFPQRQCPPA